MASFLLIGDPASCEVYIKDYIRRESIKDYDIQFYNDKVLIEHARQISHSLSISTNSKKLIILKNTITIEAQNALLKNIEELSSNFTFIICVKSLFDTLPTVRSRSFVINLDSTETLRNINICKSIISFTEGKIDAWRLIDSIESSGIFENGSNDLLKQLRILVLDPLEDHKKMIFNYCKKLLMLSPLLEKNNVNSRIILEKVFMA